MTGPGNTAQIRKRRLWKRTAFSFLISFLLLYFFISKADVGEMIRSLKGVDVRFIALAFLSHYLSYGMRGYRWKRMLQGEGFSGSTFDLAKIIFLFQSLNCVLPAKLGDLYGAHLMKINFSLSRSYALGSVFLWRVFDFAAVVVLSIGSAFILFGDKIPPEFLFAGKVVVPCLLALCALMGLFFHYKRFPLANRFEKFKGVIDSFREGLRIRGRDIPFLMGTTAIVWLLEAGRFYFICRSLAVELSWLPVLFITSSAAFLTIIPLTPSGLGAVELSLVKLLEFLGIGVPIVYPLIIWDRIIAHWSQILFGVLFLLLGGAAGIKIWEFEKEETERAAPQ